MIVIDDTRIVWQFPGCHFFVQICPRVTQRENIGKIYSRLSWTKSCFNIFTLKSHNFFQEDVVYFLIWKYILLYTKELLSSYFTHEQRKDQKLNEGIMKQLQILHFIFVLIVIGYRIKQM